MRILNLDYRIIALAIVAIAFASCQKNPTSCIDVSPSNTVKVFEEVQLNSCSSDAFWYRWEVEELQNGEQTYYYDVRESTTFSWDEAGTFDVYLYTFSENQKKEDFASEQVTIEDICFECSNGSMFSEVCGSTYEDRATFDASIKNFENAGYTCTEKE